MIKTIGAALGLFVAIAIGVEAAAETFGWPRWLRLTVAAIDGALVVLPLLLIHFRPARQAKGARR